MGYPDHVLQRAMDAFYNVYLVREANEAEAYEAMRGVLEAYDAAQPIGAKLKMTITIEGRCLLCGAVLVNGRCVNP